MMRQWSLFSYSQHWTVKTLRNIMTTVFKVVGNKSLIWVADGCCRLLLVTRKRSFIKRKKKKNLVAPIFKNQNVLACCNFIHCIFPRLFLSLIALVWCKAKKCLSAKWMPLVGRWGYKRLAFVYLAATDCSGLLPSVNNRISQHWVSIFSLSMPKLILSVCRFSCGL